jgi:peptidoglycan-associated lipoprotein
MKNLSKLLLLTLASAALFLAGCSKKPTRPVVTDTQMGDTTIDPNAEAIASDLGGLETRTPGTPDDANKSVVEPIYFPLDRAAVPPGERGKLQAAVKWLADNPTKNLVLVGHCDWRGTAEYNLGLGDRRANSVKLFLQSLGVNPARLETLSKGSTLANKTGGEAEWAKDRRVDFIELIKQ